MKSFDKTIQDCNDALDESEKSRNQWIPVKDIQLDDLPNQMEQTRVWKRFFKTFVCINFFNFLILLYKIFKRFFELFYKLSFFRCSAKTSIPSFGIELTTWTINRVDYWPITFWFLRKRSIFWKFWIVDTGKSKAPSRYVLRLYKTLWKISDRLPNIFCKVRLFFNWFRYFYIFNFIFQDPSSHRGKEPFRRIVCLII